MVSLLKTKMVGENVWTLPEYGLGNKIKKIDLPEGLTLPLPKLYRVLINVFIQGLSKIAVLRTTYRQAESVPNQIIQKLIIVRGHG